MNAIDSNITNALLAYQDVAKKINSAISTNEADTPKPQGTFKELVKNVVSDTVDATKKSENLSMKAIAGQADMRDVVQAVNSAEIALETVVTVRDSAVKAYQEILNMPI